MDRAKNFLMLHRRAVQGPNHPPNTERTHRNLNLFNDIKKEERQKFEIFSYQVQNIYFSEVHICPIRA